ncbi:MAG: penicillin-binding protein beta-lactamase class [Ilumatobacteraceae bacterium]|nr:penicillin-binding protein beta-lactamase class [Ilumatobacteraceae bacterium]
MGVTIDQQAVQQLMNRARREVDAGLLPSAQVALALNGQIVAFQTFGDATDETRYVVFSATKAFVAGAMWAVIGDGLIDVSVPVAQVIPEFGTNDKDAITIEQVMLHTSGFPHAPLRILDGATSEGRSAAFAMWKLNWEPGSTSEYHATSAHWVLAELIERVTGRSYLDVVHERVAAPAGLQRVLGDTGHRAAELVVVGEEATPDELEAVFGMRELPVGEVTKELLMSFNEPEVQLVGVPGAGGVMRAADLALYYQAVLHNPGGMWKPDVLADATTNVRNHLPDRLTGVPANRTLGLLQAGDDGRSNMRGMGRTVSPGTVGHNGAGGQIAWGDPATGLSFGYCTNGLDQNQIREPRRTTSLASLAAVCAITT